MSTNTTIEWTQATWNPVRGCSRVSEGCRYCYAEGVAARFSGEVPTDKPGVMKRQPFFGFADRNRSGSKWTGKVDVVESAIDLPLRWRKPRKIFVNSMSDLFHEGLPDEAIDRVFAVMALCPQHTFQILTKRPKRMHEWFANPKLISRMADALFDHIGPSMSTHDTVESWCKEHGISRKERDRKRDIIADGGGFYFFKQSWPLKTVWLGVSCENQETADERIPMLLQTPAAVRFISAEPLLGPIDLTALQPNNEVEIDALNGTHGVHRPLQGRNTKLDWVISGGESGPGARPAPPEWFRSIRDQCAAAAGVAYFHKQNGNWSPIGPWRKDYQDVPVGDGTYHRLFRIGKKAAGAMLDGREHREFPEVVHAVA